MPSTLQYTSAPVLFVVGLLSCLLPRLIAYRVRNIEAVLQLGTCLAAGACVTGPDRTEAKAGPWGFPHSCIQPAHAGVFIAGGFVHLLAEAAEDAGRLDDGYPYLYLSAALGFVLVYWLDFFAAAVVEQEHGGQPHNHVPYYSATQGDPTPVPAAGQEYITAYVSPIAGSSDGRSNGASPPVTPAIRSGCFPATRPFRRSAGASELIGRMPCMAPARARIDGREEDSLITDATSIQVPCSRAPACAGFVLMANFFRD